MGNGVDFTYTVGLDAKTDQLTKKISSFQESLQKRPIDINIDFPGLKNQGAVKNALDSLGVSMDRVKKVTTETITLTDKQGKAYDEAKKLVVQYVNEFGKLATAYVNVDNQTGASIKKQKEYDAILKSTEKTLNNTQHVEEKQRQAIEATANELNASISEWKELAATHQADSPRAKELETRINSLNNSLKQQAGATQTGAAGLQNWATTMQRAIKQSFAYALAMRAIRMAQQELNKAIRYTVDLNTEMTKIKILQVEGAKTSAEIDRLANSFNRLAKEMGASTLEVAKGSVEWLRQGKTIEETSQLLKSTLMLSKLGNMEAADATEKLTSTLNGYKMAASEATSVVDKLVAVDNVAATSVKELTTALQYSAAVAEQTGVSFEQLVSYIGVVSETTRQNAESIGQGMKTMLTRMQDIKGGKLDEDGMGINNVEIALRRANIQLRDSKDSFRDFGTVLEELAGEWETLSETEQAFIAKSIAGIRQVNMFTVLMTNMNRALELQDVQFTSAGLAASRYQIYMESLEAKISVFKATLEGLYQDAIESGFIGSIIDAGTKILKMIEDMGGLEVAVKRLTAAYIALKVAMFALNNLTTLDNINQGIKFFMGNAPAFQGAIQGILRGLVDSGKGASGLATILKKLIPASVGVTSSITSTGAAVTGAATGFGALVSAALPWIAVGAAVVVTAIAIEKAIVTQKEAYEGMIEAQEKATEVGEQISSVEELKEKYDELKIALEDNTKSEEEQVRLREELDNVIDELAKKLPGLAILYDKEGKSVAILAGNYEELAANLKSAREEAEKTAEKNAKEFLFKNDYFSKINWGSGEKFAPEVADTKDLEKLYENWQKTGDPDDLTEYYKKLGEYGEAFVRIGAEGADSFITTLNEGIDEDVKNHLIEMANEVAAVEQKNVEDNYKKRFQEQYDMIFRQNLGVQGANETQIDSRMKFGTGDTSEQDYLDYLISDRIPALNSGITQLKDSFETLANGKIIGTEQIDSLKSLGIIVEANDDLVQELFYEYQEGETVVRKQIKSSDDFANVLLDVFENTEITTEEILAFAESYFSLTAAEQDALINAKALEEQMKATAEANKAMVGEANAVANALMEQSENGSISADTAYELISANAELGSMLEKVGDGYRFTNDFIGESTILKMQEYLATQINANANFALSGALDSVVRGEYMAAASQLARAAATDQEKASLQGLLDVLNILDSWAENTTYAGSGSSSKQEDPRIKEQEEIIENLEDEIDLYEDEKDAIKKSQDQYHDWIDLKKKALELTKEENDYLKEQSERTTNLSKLKKEIAMLELDNTEEARAKRLELEEQAAELEKEITENTEERRYDLQMQALENLKDAFDAMIEKQIEAIDLVIEGIRDQIEAIRDIIEDLREEGRSGSSGNNYGPDGSGTTNNANYDNPYEDDESTTYVVGKPIGDPAGENTVYASPLENFRITQGPNGAYSHGASGGWDLATAEGQTIASMGEGVVSGVGVAGKDNPYGNYIDIRDADGNITRYAHLENAPTAEIGENVTMGQAIGTVGSTGNSTGPHLHVEFRDKDGNPIKTPPVDFVVMAEKSILAFEEVGRNLEGLIDNEVKLSEDAMDKITEGNVTMVEAIENGFISAGDKVSSFVISATNGIDKFVYEWDEGLHQFVLSVEKTAEYMRKLAVQAAIDKGIEARELAPGKPIINKPGDIQQYAFHDGGLVESHHDGNFAGNLRSNEVFSKLLKGEYVATEGQMDNFLKNVLPTIATNIPTGRYNQSSNINVSMPINVEGNLDKSVIPDIKKIANQVIEEINRSLISRGYVRPANNTLS